MGKVGTISANRYSIHACKEDQFSIFSYSCSVLGFSKALLQIQHCRVMLSAILDLKLNSIYQTTVPSFEILNLYYIQYQMARIFNFLPQSSLCHIFGTEILISSLLEIMVAVDNKDMYWPQILAFYLYTQFLLVFPSGNCDSKILHILD